MNEPRLKILKTMNEATGRMDLTMFSQAVNLEPNQAMAEVQELAKDGFLRKVGGGFGLTEKGKNGLKISVAVSQEKAFNFYVDVGKPLGFNAYSLEEFYRQIKQICSDSLEFHLYRGDFENWLRDVLGVSELAKDFEAQRIQEFKGEELRRALLKVIDARYGVAELL